MNKLKKVAAALAAGAALSLTGCGLADNTRFNAWADGCMALGGHIAPTSLNADGIPDWYECFKADQIVQVPGFDNEED